MNAAVYVDKASHNATNSGVTLNPPLRLNFPLTGVSSPIGCPERVNTSIGKTTIKIIETIPTGKISPVNS